MTKGRAGLILLIPVEILILYWLGITLYEYPHKIHTYRNHEICGWVWQNVPVRVDGSWRFGEAGGSLTCEWDLELSNYSRSNTVRLSEVIYILRDRHGAEIMREKQSVYPDSGPYLEIGPGEALSIGHAFPIPRDKARLVARAHIELAADIRPD